MKLIDEIIFWPGLHGRPDSAKTQVQIFENIESSNRDKIVILTELPDNPGCSVTNGVEILAKIVANKYNLPPATAWIEHYPKRDGRGPIFDETFDLITFGQPYAFKSIKWTRSDWPAIRKLITGDENIDWADL